MAGHDAGLLIGTRGWRYPEWVGRFYPDDIPQEWWLSYYSNEFRTVLVPDCDILTTTADIIEDWSDDVDEDFRFFIELNDSASWRQCLSLIEPLGSQVGGYLLEVQDADAGRVQDMLDHLTALAPVCVTGAIEAQLGIDWGADQPESPMGRIVTVEETEVSESKGAISAAVAGQLTDPSPKQLRNLLENSLTSMKGCAIKTLFFGEDIPDIKLAQQAMLLKDLVEY